MVTMANVGSVFKEGPCGGPGNFTMTVDSTTIDNLHRKDTELKKEIDKIKDNLQNNFGDDIQKLKECCEENTKKNEAQDSQINEINTNISFLKGWNTRQDDKINSLNKNVIVDNTYNNFQEWFENVYMKNPGKYNWKPGDIYINNNPNNIAVNGTWISTGDSNTTYNPNDPSTHPINNRVELTIQQPSDKISILGIDPIKVDHTSKHEWIVSMDPDKLGKMISELPRLDLSKTQIKLGDVFTTPIYKDDARFELNVTVEGDTLLNNLIVEGLARFRDVIINDLKVETISSPNVTIEHNATIQENLTVHNHTTTEYITVNETAKIENLDLDNEIRINTEKNPCSGQYNDIIKKFNGGIGAVDQKYVSINQTLFQPSFAKFIITSQGEKYGDRTRLPTSLRHEWNPEVDANGRTRLIGVGGDMMKYSVLAQPFGGFVGDMVPMAYNTPDIFRLGDTGIIVICNSGVYNISYLYNMYQNWNMWANRAGLALVKINETKFDSIGRIELAIEDLVDSKREGGSPAGTTNAWIYDDNEYRYRVAEGSDPNAYIKRLTGHFGLHNKCWSCSGSTTIEIPCGEFLAIVPYIKTSQAGGAMDNATEAQYPGWSNHCWINLTNGKWNSGAFSQINIQKIANSTTQSTANGRTIN